MTNNAVVSRIVVGVDGSSTGDAALRWAIEEATLRQAKIDVIHAWQEPPAGTPAAEATAHALEALMGGDAQRSWDAVVSRVFTEGFAGRSIHIRAWAAHGQAGPVLVEAARD